MDYPIRFSFMAFFWIRTENNQTSLQFFFSFRKVFSGETLSMFIVEADVDGGGASSK